MTATTATPLAVLTGFALSHPLNLSFHSSGTAESTSVNLGIAERLYFLAYFMRRALTFGGEACEVDEWVDIRSRTMADTQRRCSSDWDWGGGAIIVWKVYRSTKLNRREPFERHVDDFCGKRGMTRHLGVGPPRQNLSQPTSLLLSSLISTTETLHDPFLPC